MNIQIDYFYKDAIRHIKNYCKKNQSPEEYVIDYILNNVVDQEGFDIWFSKKKITHPNFLFEFRTRPYESPIYCLCKLEEETMHLMVITKKDAKKQKRFDMIEVMNKLSESPN